jgi:hypothetical protein
MNSSTTRNCLMSAVLILSIWSASILLKAVSDTWVSMYIRRIMLFFAAQSLIITAYQQNRITQNSDTLRIAAVASALRLLTTIACCCSNFLLISERKELEVFVANVGVIHLLCTLYDAICLARSLQVQNYEKHKSKS